MKKAIRLTESDLRNIVRRSVGKILREFGSDGPDFADYEVPGYEGTNVPDGIGYSELDANEDFDDFLSDSQYVNQPNIGRHAQSASDFDTDDALFDISSNYDEYGGPRRFGESKKRLGRIIRESIKKVLIENDDEWRESYRDDKGNIFQSKGSGPKKQWRTLRDNKKGTQPKAGKYDGNEWREAYMDDKGNRIQSKGHGPNKQFRIIKSDNK